MSICVEVSTNQYIHDGIIPQRLIITCEACRSAHYLDAHSEEEAAELFRRFQCKNGCDRVYYSYITVGQIILGTENDNHSEQPATEVKLASAGK